MKMNLCNFVVLLLTITFSGRCSAISLDKFFPYGVAAGDRKLPNKDEGATNEIELRTPFVFYGETYFSLFININGIISFLTEIPYFFNAQFPLDYPVIAPFYSDVDTSGSGNIWFREISDASSLSQATTDLRKYFKLAAQFQPSSIFITTYDEVGSFQSRRDKVNTFQVVMVTDGKDSYVIFYYADGGLQWLQGDGKTSGLPDALAQAGFVAGDGRLFTLRGSGTDQVRNLDRWSNVGENGVWMFQVGKVSHGKNIQSTDLLETIPSRAILDPFDQFPHVEESCAIGGAICHSSGSCVDYSEGFCCRCNDDFYGNGINCITKDIPIRVTGTFFGSLNGIDIKEADFHSYVLSTEGRTYTAISRIPREIGYDLQSLTSIGEGIAWLFAVPKEGVPNGFTQTGGSFNRSVEVNFPQTGHKATVEQVFVGLDVFNNVAVTTTVSGSLPTLPTGSEIELDAFTEEFTKVKSGQLRARSNRAFKLKGQSISTPYSVETYIRYEECENAPQDPQLKTLRLKIAENVFIRFDEAEAIVRFSFSAKVGTLEEEDPCLKGREECGANSQCIVDGDTFRCVCEQGYDYVFDSTLNAPICLDMNECDLGRDLCAVNAICINTPGSYSCRCNTGYTGDGHYCNTQFTCHNAGCDPNAICEKINGQPECRCNIGYKGDGFFCTPDFGDESCHIAQNCSPYAVCEPTTSGFTCRCLQGYIGDGYTCDVDRYSRPVYPPLQTSDERNLQPHQPYYPSDPILQRPVEDSDIHDSHQQAQSEPQPPSRPYDPFLQSLLIAQNQQSVQPECIGELCWCPANYVHNKATGLCDKDTGQTFNKFESTNPRPTCGTTKCTCPTGYVYNVLLNVCDVASEDLPSPVCFEGLCLCPYGLAYHTEEGTCVSVDLPEYDYASKGGAPPCNVINNCHPNAQCLYFSATRENRCTCNAGYAGDGFYCSPSDVSCDKVNFCHLNAQCIYDDEQLMSICVCKIGYVGDGLVCTAKDDCSSTQDCDLNAQCLYDAIGQRYVCKCNNGYQGDGFFCSPVADTSCRTLQNCNPSATCIYDSYSRRHICQCNEGFEGDGYFCQKVQTGCNVLNDCGSNAACQYDEIAGGYQCRCREGFSGDGSFCQAIRNCLNDPGVCHYRATCERSQYNAYSATCVCLSGYNGDGFSCEEAPDHEKDILLMNQGLSVLRMPINQDYGNGFPIHVDPYMTAVGNAIDCMNGRYYWTDVGSRSIRSSKYDGSGRSPVISGGKIGSPEDVALDWVSQNIFWTDSLNDLVFVATTNGSKIRTVIEGDLVNPRGITVHPGFGLLFWSDWNRDNPKIEVSGMDGSGRRVLLSGPDVSLPNSLVIDYETSTLCWADAGTHRIECIGVEGFGRRVVIEPVKYPFGLTLHHGSYFYTDWNDTLIHQVNKYTGNEEGVRNPPPGGSGKLYGIVAVPDQCPPVSNMCQVANGDCPATHLCLPNGRGRHTCACADDAKLAAEKCVDYQF